MANGVGISLSIEVNGASQLEAAAVKALELGSDYKVWTFDGEIGAGKTTFIKAIGSAVGITDLVNSPTFSIVNEYRDQSDTAYYHFDFYRIKNENEARDIGTEEYFYSGDYCFIEWPSLIPSILPDRYLKIDIQILDREKRLINFTKHG